MESDKPDLNSILENARAQLEMYGRASQEDIEEATKEIHLTRPKDQEMEDASGPLFDKAKESAGFEPVRDESVKSTSGQNLSPDGAIEPTGADIDSQVEAECVEVEDEESSNKNFDSSTMTLGDQQSFQNQVELTSQTTYTNIHELTGPVKDDILIVTGATVEPSDTTEPPSQVSHTEPDDVSSETTQVTLENVIAPTEVAIDDELHKPDELQHNQMTGTTNYFRGWKSDPCRDTLQDSMDMDGLPPLDQMDGCSEKGDSALKAGAGTREGSPVRPSPKLMLQVAERLSQLELHEGKQCAWLKQGICEKGKDCICERNDINHQISKESSVSDSYLDVKDSSESKSEGIKAIDDETPVQNYIINTHQNNIDNRQVEFVEYFDANEVDKSDSAIRKSSDKSIFEDEGFVDSKELLDSTKVIFISDQEDEQSCKPFEMEDDASCLLEPSSAGRSLDLQSDLEAKPSLTDVHVVQKHPEILEDVITDSERAVSTVDLDSNKDLDKRISDEPLAENNESPEKSVCDKPQGELSDHLRANKELSTTSAKKGSHENPQHANSSSNENKETPKGHVATLGNIDHPGASNMESVEPPNCSRVTKQEKAGSENQKPTEKELSCAEAREITNNSKTKDKESSNLDEKETINNSEVSEKQTSNVDTDHVNVTPTNTLNKGAQEDYSKAVKKQSKLPSTSQPPFETATLLPQIFDVLSKNREQNKDAPKAKPMCIGRTIFEAFIKNMSKTNSDSPELRRLKAILEKANMQELESANNKIATLNNSSCSTDLSSSNECSTTTQIDLGSLHQPNSSLVPKNSNESSSSEDDSESDNETLDPINIIERLSKDPHTIPLIPTAFLNRPQQPITDSGSSSGGIPLLMNNETLADLNIRASIPVVPLSPIPNTTIIEDPQIPHISETDFESINNFDEFNSSKEIASSDATNTSNNDGEHQLSSERCPDRVIEPKSDDQKQNFSNDQCSRLNPKQEVLGFASRKIDPESDVKTPIIEEVHSHESSSISPQTDEDSPDKPVALEISDLVWQSVRETPVSPKVSPDGNDSFENSVDVPTIIVEVKSPISVTMEGNDDRTELTSQTANDQNLLSPLDSEIRSPTLPPCQNINDFISEISVPHIRPPAHNHPGLQIHSVQSANMDSEEREVGSTKTPPRPPPRPRATVQTKKKKLNFFKKLFGLKAKN